MREMHLPWLELAIVIPLIGSLLTWRVRPEQAQRRGVIAAALTLLCSVCAWEDFTTLHTFAAHDHWYFSRNYLGDDVLVIDELSAPLLSLASLTYLVTMIATLKTKIRRFSFSGTLLSLSILIATLCSRESWLLVALLGLGTVPIYFELRSRKKPTNVFVLHMGLSMVLLSAGWALVQWEGSTPTHSVLAVALLTVAVLIRTGVAPLHCWMTDLFEHATFGSALLFVTPLVGAYAAMHFVFPIAPEWALKLMSVASMVTAVYAGAMATVQREARRFFCYLFLSHASFILVGLEIGTPMGLAGALSVWLAVGLSLTGFGLVLRSVEARMGRLSLREFHGLYEHIPTLAVFFALTGLASVGFPGTFGFFGTEMLIDSAVQESPEIGLFIVIAAMLNGIAILQAYFRIFTGRRHHASVSIRSRSSERIAVLLMAAIILGGGIYPQPGIASRHQAAVHLFAEREAAQERLQKQFDRAKSVTSDAVSTP